MDGISVVTASTDELCLSRSTRRRRQSSATTFSDASLSPSRPSRAVSFSTIEIRQYERILGDNPSSQSGPSISIGWDYYDDRTILKDVDEYEMETEKKRQNSSTKQLKSQMLMKREEREFMLRQLGYTKAEIASAIRSNNRTKSRRRQTVNNLNMMQFELMVEKVRGFPKSAVKKAIPTGCMGEPAVLGGTSIGVPRNVVTTTTSPTGQPIPSILRSSGE